MDEPEFRDRVTQSADGTVERPEEITEATLETLGEALSSGQAEDVATHLPDQYADALAEGGQRTIDDGGDGGSDGSGGDGATSLSREAFLERVGDRTGGSAADADELRPRAAAVLEALEESIPRAERRAVRSQLPDDLEALFTGGPDGR